MASNMKTLSVNMPEDMFNMLGEYVDLVNDRREEDDLSMAEVFRFELARVVGYNLDEWQRQRDAEKAAKAAEKAAKKAAEEATRELRTEISVNLKSYTPAQLIEMREFVRKLGAGNGRTN